MRKPTSVHLHKRGKKPIVVSHDDALKLGKAAGLKDYTGPAPESTSIEVLLKKILSCVEPKHEFPPIFQSEGAITGRMTASEPKAETPIHSRPTLDDLLDRIERAATRANGHAERFGYLANRLGADNPFPDGIGAPSDSPTPDNFIETAWTLVGILHNALDQLDRDYEVLSQLEGKPKPPVPNTSPTHG